MSRILTAALFVITLSAPALADTVPAGPPVLPHQPTGAGKPDAVSCYEAVKTGTRTRTLQCAPNSYWARLNAGSNLGGDLGIPGSAMSPGAAGGAIGGRN